MMKRSTRATFIETKKPFIIDDIDLNKILIFKKELYGKKAHLNILLGIMMKMMIMMMMMMMMMSLDHYV